MIRSMTGFGEAFHRDETMHLGFRIRSVNHKGLEVRVRVPMEWAYLESEMRQRVGQQVARGRVEIHSEFQATSQDLVPPLSIDQERIVQLANMAHRLGKICPIQTQLDINTLLRLPEVVSERKIGFRLPDFMRDILFKTLEQALTRFNAARAREGERLMDDITARLDSLSQLLSEVEALVDERRDDLLANLKARLEHIASDLSLDHDRLQQEVVFHVDRCDVTEEITRCRSHFQNVYELLRNPNRPLGKRLEFWLQEMMREVTTLGNKVRLSEGSKLVVSLKTEMEKIREQVLNIE